MSESDIVAWVGALEGVSVQVATEGDGSPQAAWGDMFFYYDPDDDPDARRFPFATIVIHDYEGFDTASHLDRPGVYRLNVSVGADTFRELFDDLDENACDYTALDRLIPHPVYGRQSWVSILNPSDESMAEVRELLGEAHARAAARHNRRTED